MKIVQITKALKMGAKALVVGASKTTTSTLREIAKVMKEEGVSEATDSGYKSVITEAHKALTNKRRKKVLGYSISERKNNQDDLIRSVDLPVKTDKGNAFAIRVWWNAKSKSVIARNIYKVVDTEGQERIIPDQKKFFFTSEQNDKIVVLVEYEEK
jgi:hypothetical protein